MDRHNRSIIQSKRVIHWWRIIAVAFALMVAAIVFWPSANDQTQRRPQATAPSSTRQAATIHVSSPCAEPVKVIAQPGKYTEVPLQSRCAGKTVNISTSLKGQQACLSYRANHDNGLIRKEGVCRGVSLEAHFPRDMELTSMEVMSDERFPVPLMVQYIYQ